MNFLIETEQLTHRKHQSLICSLTEDDHLCLSDLCVEPGGVLGGDLAAVGARRRQGDLLQQHPVDAGLTHLKRGQAMLIVLDSYTNETH